jgi:transcriptional regulator with XRE-family HTH domain
MWLELPLFGLSLGMVSPREVRAARAFLGWSRQKLADKARLSVNAVVRLEQDVVDSRTSTVVAVRTVLEEQGISFLSRAGQIEGIEFRTKRGRAAKLSSKA